MDGDDLTASSGPGTTSSGPVLLDPPAAPTGDPGVSSEQCEPIPWWWPTQNYPGREQARERLNQAFSFVTVAACCIYIFWAVHPDLVFRNTTPTGGDMGAHVWGPAYLRDVLLPSFRVTGWAPDWYAGFPAYTFYMVIPSLAIVALDVGLLPWWTAPAVAVSFAWIAWWAWDRLKGRLSRVLALAGCVLVAVLVVDIPYNIAFKVVSVSGLVTLPAAVWFLGSSLKLHRPGPELMAIASVPFLMDKTLYSILGGNIASTMAGEFAFSISFTVGLTFLGVAARGLATGRHRPWGAALLALCALCHVIPAIYIVAGTILLFLLRPTKRAFMWLATTVPVGGLIACFWYLPFYFFSTYLNDMGWEKYGRLIGPDGKHHNYLAEYLRYLIPIAPHQPTLGTGAPSDDPNMLHGRVWIALAVVGVVLSLVFVVRAGIYFTLYAGVAALAFWLMPQNRFWNARILPIYYLCIYLLAAIGIALAYRAVVMMIAGRQARAPSWVTWVLTGVAGLVVFAMLGVSIREGLPGGRLGVPDEQGRARYSWGPFHMTYDGVVRSWAKWNFEGYEGKGAAWEELRAIRDTMASVGRERGCGRAFWEYEPDLNRFGTPMALMLLPYWTDGCIGSMEGLFFEASSTTPYHFIVQTELSAQPSSAQRFDIFGLGGTAGPRDPSPYNGVEFDLGIRHLQMLGVRYFMATSDQIRGLAANDDRLTKIAATGKWDIYEVEDTELVVPLEYRPAVWSDVDDAIHSWAKPSTKWFKDPAQWPVLRTSSGPKGWERVRQDQPARRTRLEPVTVSDIESGNDWIRFRVDRVGVPVLVRTSYFPNWRSDQVTGVYRAAPNLMVVVPTEKEVTLRYGRSWLEIGSWMLTFVGLGLLLLLIRRPEPEPVVAWEFPGDRPSVLAADRPGFRPDGTASSTMGEGSHDDKVDQAE
jgi:hypothetical protein